MMRRPTGPDAVDAYLCGDPPFATQEESRWSIADALAALHRYADQTNRGLAAHYWQTFTDLADAVERLTAGGVTRGDLIAYARSQRGEPIDVDGRPR